MQAPLIMAEASEFTSSISATGGLSTIMSSRNVTQDGGEFGPGDGEGNEERVGELGGAGPGGLEQEATNVSESRSEDRFLAPEPKQGQFIVGPPAVTAFVATLAASNRARRGKKGMLCARFKSI